MSGHLEPDDQPQPKDQIDFQLVAEIVRLAGLDCRVERRPAEVLRARPIASRSDLWTVTAGSSRSTDAPRRAFVGPVGSTSVRLVRIADERHLAALVVLQAFRENPDEPLTYDEVAACGLVEGVIWA